MLNLDVTLGLLCVVDLDLALLGSSMLFTIEKETDYCQSMLLGPKVRMKSLG